MIADYLDGRMVRMEGETQFIERACSMGCPQGSVLGPLLWNVLFDELLKLKLPEGCQTIAYADDAAVMISANSRKQILEKGNQVTALLDEWAVATKTIFSPTKCQVMFLKGFMDYGPIKVTLGGTKLRIVESVRYLGRVLQRTKPRRAACEHVKLVTGKADALMRKLRRLTIQEWGLKPGQMRVIYKGVYIPIVCYAPATWPERLTAEDRTELTRSQRQALLTVTGGYSQCRVESLQAVSGCMPIDLELSWQREVACKPRGATAAERKRIREQCKETAIENWQARWEESKAEKTKRFIPDVRLRLKEGLVFNTYVTQLLNEHGNIAKYLFEKPKKRTTPECQKCGTGAVEDTLHIIWECSEAARMDARERLKTELQTPDWPCPLPALLGQGGRSFANFAKAALIERKLPSAAD